jgi:hypothetical protein
MMKKVSVKRAKVPPIVAPKTSPRVDFDEAAATGRELC